MIDALPRAKHERGSTIVTSNLPFEEWTSVFGSQRLTGARLDRLTHYVHILELNGEICRLEHSKATRRGDRHRGRGRQPRNRRNRPCFLKAASAPTAKPRRSPARADPARRSPRHRQLAWFYAALLAGLCSAVDTSPSRNDLARRQLSLRSFSTLAR